jgi:hypothetical protein
MNGIRVQQSWCVLFNFGGFHRQDDPILNAQHSGLGVDNAEVLLGD